MNTAVIRFSETPAVTVFIEDQLLFSERLDYSDDLLQTLFDKLNGFEIDTLKVLFKTSIVNSIPKNAVKISSFKLGNLVKYSCISKDDYTNLNTLADALCIRTIDGYDYISFYKHKSYNRDLIIVDRDNNDQYLCVFASNGEIIDLRTTRYRNLEKTLKYMVDSYKTTDILSITSGYSYLLPGSIKNKISNEYEKVFVDTAVFAFTEESCKDLRTELEEVNTSTFRHNNGTPKAQLFEDIIDEDDNLYSAIDKEDNINAEETLSPVKRKGLFSPKVKKEKKEISPTRTEPKQKASTSSGSFILNSSHSSDSKISKGFSVILNILVPVLFLCMVGGIVVTTVYKDRFNSRKDELSIIERDIAELEPTNLALTNIAEGKDNMEAIEAIGSLSADGIVEEVRYNKKNLEVTVAFKSPESVETYKGSLHNVIGIIDVASVGVANYNGVKYERFTFKTHPYLGMR